MTEWVRVVTYDWLMGIPSWAERDHSHLGERDAYHEFTAPPNTILHLDRELAHHLLMFKKWSVYRPGERKPYTPRLERGEERKDEKVEKHDSRRARRSNVARVNRLWG